MAGCVRRFVVRTRGRYPAATTIRAPSTPGKPARSSRAYSPRAYLPLAKYPLATGHPSRRVSRQEAGIPYSTDPKNPKKTSLHRSAASIVGPWPDPSNNSISTRPPFARYRSNTARICATIGCGG